MIPPKTIKLLSISIVLIGVMGAGLLYLSGWGRASDPVKEAEERVLAREQWLELCAKEGTDAAKPSRHAKLLMGCFKKGEPAALCEKVLATSTAKEHYPITGKGDEFDGAVEYSWLFMIEKPRNEEASSLMVCVRVQRSPATIRSISYGVSVD